MAISPLAGISAGTGAASSTQKRGDAMGKDQFLTLLMAQIKNQDPLSPMDNTEFTAQMAQFSSLEQLFSVNENLVGLQHLSNSMNNTQALNLIDKEVEAAGDLISVGNGIASAISFELPDNANDVRIQIMDSNGQVVRTLNKGHMNKGTHQVEWDAKTTGGKPVDPGLYTYSIEAIDGNGLEMSANTFLRGVVDSVTIDSGITYLHIGDKQIMLSEVTKILRAPGAPRG